MSCAPPCVPDPFRLSSLRQKEDSPIYLIRLESGDVVYPPVNLYGDFDESCRKFRVIGEEGNLTRYIINENLEYILQRRIEELDKDRSDDSFQLGQILYEKVGLPYRFLI